MCFNGGTGYLSLDGAMKGGKWHDLLRRDTEGCSSDCLTELLLGCCGTGGHRGTGEEQGELLDDGYVRLSFCSILLMHV